MYNTTNILDGTVKLKGDKSLSHRLLMIVSLNVIKPRKWTLATLYRLISEKNKFYIRRIDKKMSKKVKNM